MNCAKFYRNRLRGLDSMSGKIWPFPLDCDIAVNTVWTTVHTVIYVRLSTLNLVQFWSLKPEVFYAYTTKWLIQHINIYWNTPRTMFLVHCAAQFSCLEVALSRYSSTDVWSLFTHFYTHLQVKVNELFCLRLRCRFLDSAGHTASLLCQSLSVISRRAFSSRAI